MPEDVAESVDPEEAIRYTIVAATDSLITDCHRMLADQPVRALRLLESVARTQRDLLGEVSDLEPRGREGFGGGMADQFRPMVDMVERMTAATERKLEPKTKTRREKLVSAIYDARAGLSHGDPDPEWVARLRVELEAEIRKDLNVEPEATP